MYKYSIYKVKKGYIIIYVLFIGMLILISALTMYKFQLIRRTDLMYRKSKLEKIDNYLYKKEMVFSSLNRILIEKAAIASRADMIQCMKDNTSSFDIYFEGVQLKFSIEKELLILTYQYNVRYNEIEYYDVYPSDYGIKVNLVYSELKAR